MVWVLAIFYFLFFFFGLGGGLIRNSRDAVLITCMNFCLYRIFKNVFSCKYLIKYNIVACNNVYLLYLLFVSP